MALDHAAPRPAATVLLLRDGVDGLEVFLQVRHDAIDFASGALVFPGGRVDTGDHDIAERPELCPGPEGIDAMAMAFRVAAIRETFEECGVLLARPQGSEALIAAERLRDVEGSHRAPLCRGELRFADVLDSERLVLATDLLVPFAHWITPANQAKRYDTHFFLAAAPTDQGGAHNGSEAVDSVWLTPERAKAGVANGEYKMMFPTHMNLAKLGRHTVLAGALEAARAARVVTVEPELVKSETGLRQLRIPIEADYGGDLFTVTLPSAMPGRDAR